MITAIIGFMAIIGVIVSLLTSVMKAVFDASLFKGSRTQLIVLLVSIAIVIIPALSMGMLTTENIPILTAEIVTVFGSAITFYEVIAKNIRKLIEKK